MTFGVTEQGFRSKSFQEIMEDYTSSLKNELGLDVGSNPDSVINVITNILALSDAQNWDATEAILAMIDVDQATGSFLEYLCKLKGISRKYGGYSVGDLHLKLSGSIVLPSDSSFYDTSGNTFKTTSSNTLSKSSVVSFTFSFPAVNVGDVVSIVLSGTTYSVTVTSSNIVSNVYRETLLQSIVDDGYLLVDNTLSSTTVFSITGETGITVEDYTCEVEVKYTELGDFNFQENTVTNGPAYVNLVSVTNPEVITGGSEVESDEELRIRFYNTSASLGKSTVPSIRSAILSVEGVTDVSVIENRSDEYDEYYDIPAHNIKVIVKGGESKAIADKLWEYKGAGIGTSGSELVIIKDEQGQNQAINFEKVSSRYIYVNIDYRLYSEEVFPADGEDLIKQSVVESINSLSVGEDVIQGRLYGGIYQTVAGVSNIVIKLAYKDTSSGVLSPFSSEYPIEVPLNKESYCEVGFINLTRL